MSYHNTSSTATSQSTTNAQGQTAPAGYHYMPDGSLMLDTEHARLYGAKTIRDLDINFTDIKAAGETRTFIVSGENGAVFSLEIKNEDDYYYNFQTELFQATKTRLSDISIEGNSYKGNIVFPAVTDADQYDFLLFVGENTQHSDYIEVRFLDSSIDINSSTGSNSNAIQKVIYQTLDVDIVITGFSGNSDITGYFNTAPNAVSQTITTSRGRSVATIPISITVTVTAGALSIDRQPTENDIMSFVTRTIGSAPINIPGEDIYPAITTAADSTSEGGTTVNGSSTGTTVTTHVVSSTIASVGDRVLGNAALAAATITVATVSGGSGKTFTISEAISIADDLPLTFSNRRNYRWPIDNIDKLEEGMQVLEGAFFSEATTIKEYLTQITVLEGEVDEYKIDIERVPSLDTLSVKPVISRDATTKVKTSVQSANITFSSQANFSFRGATAKIFGYGVEEISRLYDYDLEFSDLKAELNTVTTTTTAAVNPANTTIPVTSKVGIVDKTTQTVNGAITASKTVVLDSVTGLGIGQSLYAVSAGTLTGTPTIITINEATKTITLSSIQTFNDGITLTFPNSIISGAGIDPAVVNPYVDTISSLDLTSSVAQTLEDGQTLTFTGAGNIVTITGNIKVNKAGNEDIALRFDIDKFLTQH
tara:strand:- start:65 stop:2017 length:1953 start_codon:yes stop_codon:yes gene_type:complete